MYKALWTCVLNALTIKYIQRNGYGTSLFETISGDAGLFSQAASPFHIPPCSAMRVPFHLHREDWGAAGGKETIWAPGGVWVPLGAGSKCLLNWEREGPLKGPEDSLWFWFTFLWWLVMLISFSCNYVSVCLLWENVYSDPLPIFKSDFFFFFCYWIACVLYIFWILTLSDT